MITTVREFQYEDITNGLLEVYKEVWAISSITDQTLQAYLANDNIMFVAEREGRVVGTLTLHLQQKLIRDGGLCGMIEDVAVLEALRGQGIGDMLVKAAIERAKELNCYKVILSCFPEREAFYQRAGFRKESATMRYDIKQNKQ